MGLSLGITGMDAATEAEIRAAFDAARSRLAGRWQLASEQDADHVVVDMDSMYGPMSWIRLHASGKQVIGLTSSPRTQADHRLGRPLDGKALADLLDGIADHLGIGAVREDAGAAPATGDSPARPLPEPLPEAQPASATPAPAPADELPEEHLARGEEESAAPPEASAVLEPAPVAEPPPVPPPPQAPPPPAPSATAPAPEPTPEPTPAPNGLADWLAPGALPGRWRYAHGGAELLFDADSRVYHGPASLKPLAPLFEGEVRRSDFAPLDQTAWSGAIAGLGESQPLARLLWFGALLAGKGALLPGNDPQGKYRLSKWPQTEREYPKHFRIATAMMKGPATLDEIAAASSVPVAEVADFVNANLATGYAEFVPPPAPEPTEPPKPGGLFGRMRGR